MTLDTAAQSPQEAEAAARARRYCEQFRLVQSEVERVIVGQAEVLHLVLAAVIAGGHVLLEGVPGLGKTLLVRTLADVLDLSFNRIQFTPDLMPADITGTNIVAEDEHGRRRFVFQHGPVFSNLLLADEINRATPKTQSALLEAMQEHSVTIAGAIHRLDEPFFVLATQNPLEQEGTYPLPEAQLDRFLFKVLVEYPSLDELSLIVDRTTGAHVAAAGVRLNRQELASMQALSRETELDAAVKEYALRVVRATHPEDPGATEQVRRFVRYGSSPRGAQAIVLTARVEALLNGRFNVSMDDIDRMALPSLRHRILLNFEGEAEGIRTDDLILGIAAAAREQMRPRLGV